VGYSPRNRWPEGVEACIKCDKDHTLISYGQRGLCAPCVKLEIAAGNFEKWPPLTRVRYASRNKTTLYKVVINIGMSDLARRLEVSTHEVKDWLGGAEVPEIYLRMIESLHVEISRLSKEADKGRREEEFFKHFESGVRYFKGKSI
jgi:hypothetical protein